MARHRKAYEGEKLTARLHLQLTPGDRAAIAAAAAEQGITAAEFGRALVRNGLRAYHTGTGRRAAYRRKIVEAVDRLTVIGTQLNRLAHRANEVKWIEDEDAVVVLCRGLVDLLRAVPPRMIKAPKDAETRRLVAAVCAVGNNIQQLRKLAQSRLHMRSNMAVRDVEGAIKSLEMMLRQVDREIVQALSRVLPPFT